MSEIKQIKLDDLIPYTNNSRTHSESQIAQIAASIKEFGFTNPILTDGENGIIAGHGRLLAAQKLKMQTVPVIELSHLTKAQRKAYIIADNKLALNAGWDDALLKIELDDLKELEFNINLIGFSVDELNEVFNEDQNNENPYTKKIEAPVYSPSGEKPELSEMFDRKKTDELLNSISNTEMPDDLRFFLVSAAHRHTEFNYEQIAEYYCHAEKEIQKLMEDSALVVIDFNRAIENSYIILNEKMKETYLKEYSKNGD